MLKTKEIKLLTLALDGAATDFEAASAAAKLIKLLRKRKATVTEFSSIAHENSAEIALYTVLDFGKYRGYPLADVPENYLKWILRNCDLSHNLRKDVEKVLYARN